MTGRSTLIATAPKSPNIIVQYGPARARVISNIRMLSRGRIVSFQPCFLVQGDATFVTWSECDEGLAVGSINASSTKNNKLYDVIATGAEAPVAITSFKRYNSLK